MPIAVASPWQPTDSMTQVTVDQLIASEMREGNLLPVTRDVALRVPGIKRAHGVHCAMFAEISFRQTDAAGQPVDQQPEWLTNSQTGVSPYHRKFGIASDLFMNGWAALAFNADMTDSLHVPFGAWWIERGEDGIGHVRVDEGIVPAAFRDRVVAIPLGYGENGLLVDGIDTVREARLIEQAYMDRLENPIPLTILGIPRDVWESWTPEERKEYRDQYAAARKAGNGSVALKVAEFPVDFPGETAADLYESGRNAVRLDIANHTGSPASLIEGVRQGGSGGGTEMRYQGVGEGGASRSDLWEFGLAKRFMNAFEARLSLDDVSPAGLSIRGDRSHALAIPTPTSNPASEA
ncbi:hypothetical protein CQ040_02805 [Microbacterium sp. MYb54]|nr:hypothetical protein CQ032_04025 [Microbacterium sp. MYb43]PQZ82105.1 hypothetical protein CQ031_01425 [Microbacterium sp. MYb40]PRB22965.1 hypothetical protein CQ037_18180 [Microbacterium sp. MYb50]PRB24195.1 hypothetical protein CQ040_02805 [Microbacterium sp. MYb54]PRB69679.1 hypothetical protein CQ021_02810 [Microbacterium sp. MYb24]PRB79080.1 hypothetical protein CQ027_02100 [Microbacterium sp. MYb32]